MKLFIAVVFFCVNGECSFWKSNDNFYKVEECAVEVQKAMQFFNDQGVVAAGTCLPISTKNNI
jgi:hypothetical protein